jgi:hypothetical protein
MQGALTAAWDLISTYDRSGQSVIDRTAGLDFEDADSGLGSDDQVDDEDGVAGAQASRIGLGLSNQVFAQKQVKHIHTKSRRVLDGCIAKYQHRVEQALRKDQAHTAEADLQQLMAYAQERKEKYGVEFDKVQMQEQLAQIYKRLGKHGDVFDVLCQLLPTEGSSDDHTLEHSRHYHMIAETYFELWNKEDKKENLLDAQTYALSAFTIREQLQASEELLRETAKLLADIYEALSSPVEAEVYRDMFLESQPESYAPHPSPHPDAEPSIASGNFGGSPSLDDGLDINKELVRAIRDRDVVKVRRLLQSEEIDLDYCTRQNWTPLHYAFHRSQGDKSMPLALLERGFNIDADDEDGRTVLHQAAARADAPMVRLAIHRDASKEAKDKVG